MKTQTFQNRLAVVSILSLFALAVFLVVDAQPAESSVLQGQSSTAYTDSSTNDVVAQIESVLSTSARHVFDKDYWIANMHSIKSF